MIRCGGAVDEHAIRMFQREVQTLALLKHPGIASICEAGHTEDGRHFFTMESRQCRRQSWRTLAGTG